MSSPLNPRETSGNKLKFNNKPVATLTKPPGHSFFFMVHEGRDIWLTQRKVKHGYLFQWRTFKDGRFENLHRPYKNRSRLDLSHDTRDKNLIKTLHNKAGIDKNDIEEFLEKLGLFIGENQYLLEYPKQDKKNMAPPTDKALDNREPEGAVKDQDYINKALELIESENPLQEITDYIGRAVKHDEVLIKLSLLVMASAYTPKPLNLALEGPQSEGKTYALVEASKVFPKGDVWNLAGMTPEALTREHGVLIDNETGESLEPEILEIKKQLNELGNGKGDKARQNKLREELQAVYDRGVKVVNLEGKILLFLEAPKTQTLEKLRPIMSHDTYEIQYKFVDRPFQGGPLVTMDAKLKGWPVFLYATADNRKGNIWEQIRSRFIVVSPEMTSEKYGAANEFTALMHSQIRDPEELEEERRELERCQAYILFIKNILYGAFNQVHGVGALPPDKVMFTYDPMALKLEKGFPHKTGQHMRDFKYFMALMDVSSLFNLPNRPYMEARGVPYWMVTKRDLKNVVEVFDKYHFFIKGSELPLRYFKEIILKMDLPVESLEGDQGFTNKDIRKAFKEAGYPNSDNWIKENVLEPLEDLGLLNKSRKNGDKRIDVYSPFKEKYNLLSSNSFLKINYTVDDLKKEFEKIKNVLTVKSSIGLKIICNGRYPPYFKKIIWGIFKDRDYDILSNLEKTHLDHFSVSIFLSDGNSPDSPDNGHDSDNLQFEDKSLFFKDKEGRREDLKEEINKLGNEAAKGNHGAYEDMEARSLELNQLGNPRAFYDHHPEEILKGAYETLKHNQDSGLQGIQFRDGLGELIGEDEDKYLLKYESWLLKDRWLLQVKAGAPLRPSQKLIDKFHKVHDDPVGEEA